MAIFFFCFTAKEIQVQCRAWQCVKRAQTREGYMLPYTYIAHLVCRCLKQ